MTNALEFVGLVKEYHGGIGKKPLIAVNGVSFTVAEGEVFGFIGPNGAGKSTTIKILTGALRATSGSGSLFGVDVSDPRARVGLGFVPENPSLYDYLTPLELLKMGMSLHRVQVDQVENHCRKWLGRFGLESAAGKPIRQFSKGMVQRTALAHALAVNPRMLVLDEPLSGLDPIGRKDVVDILSEYKRQGGTIFLTSHVLHDIERLADRFGLIHKGTLRAVQSPSELVDAAERVVVRSMGHNKVPQMISDGSGRWYCDVPRADLWEILGLLRQSGHDVIEVKPALSLEAAFLSVVVADK